MKKVKFVIAALGMAFFVSSCALTEDGIVPQKDVLKSDGVIYYVPDHKPPPPPPPPPPSDDE